MLKSLAVWFIVLFLRSCGRNVDKRKISRHNKRYNTSRRTNVEKRVPRGRTARVQQSRYHPAENVSTQTLLYSREGKTVRIKTRVAGRRYHYA